MATHSDELMRARIEVTRLRQQVNYWKLKCRTLKDQYDAVVRQLHAVPTTIRADGEDL